MLVFAVMSRMQKALQRWLHVWRLDDSLTLEHISSHRVKLLLDFEQEDENESGNRQKNT